MAEQTVPNRGPQLIAVCSTFFGLALASVLLRIYVRLRLVRAFGWDDAFIIAALIFDGMFTVSAIKGVKYGTGRHMDILEPADIEKALMYWYLCYPAYCLAMIAAKISVGLFLLRVTVQAHYRRIIYLVMGSTVATGLVFFFVSVFQCSPVSYFWQKFTGSGTCINIDAIIGVAFAYSGVASICDFTFGLLPIFLVWNLNMAKNQKLMLIPILSMACVASVAVTVRMSYLMKFKSPDFLWDTLDVAIWSDIEQGLAITAGSLATLRPLYRDITKRLLGWTDANTAPTDPKDSRKWYRTPSVDHHKRSGPFSLVTITRPGEGGRSSQESDEEYAARLGGLPPIKNKSDDGLTGSREKNQAFNSWTVQVGDRSDEDLTVAHGITRQTDVFMESSHNR